MTYQDGDRPGTEARCVQLWRELRDYLPGGALTAIDLGCAEGKITAWLVPQLPPYSVVVGIDGLPAHVEACRDAGCIALVHTLSVEDLSKLGSCESFDLVLALNLIHHFGADWQTAGEAILAMGKIVVVETPDARDAGACHAEVVPDIVAWLDRQHAFVRYRSPSHTSPHPRHVVILKECGGQVIKRPYFTSPERPASYHVAYHEQVGIRPRDGHRWAWTPGINLQTFLSLGGQVPAREAILAEVDRLQAAQTRHHGDIRPWNLVIGAGYRLTLIDWDDPCPDDQDDAKGWAWVREALGRTS